ncbi:hypothetical protein K9M79_05395 [Candidatus Woesearchaeota archaeon]|nr:hypothetical protein [Candidatus Woesearchaeota archaeon]
MVRKKALKAMIFLILFAGFLCIISLNFLIQGIPIINIGLDAWIINSMTLLLSLGMLIRAKIELLYM